ncbi:MAG: hypothetical protein HN948_06240 [Clostridia bacterium]|jgi:hypothetical protein|nr:hypothetical protein [Clostridia bacterium]MBT7122596.1 hypothetical protein [Clostridia bacterium]
MRKIKVIAVLFSAVLLVGVLAACGASVIDKPLPSEGGEMVEVEGFCKMEVDGTTITVTGETNFIAGTLIHISIVAQSGEEIDSVKVNKSEDAISQTFQITDDKYKNVTSFTAFISIAPSLYGKQSESVQNTYGKKFEFISSEHIWNKDGIIVMFASETYDM